MAAAQEEEDGIISAINVTPLVDVMLVLLVVFMVTAKIIVSTSIPLDLPKAAKGETVQMVFGLELYANGDILIDGKRMNDDKTVLALAKEALAKNKDMRAVIRADKTVQHGRIIRILDLLKQAGVSRIAFGVTPVSAEVDAVPAAPKPSPEPPKEGAPEAK
jgi:biopolymer transport protein ExbD